MAKKAKIEADPRRQKYEEFAAAHSGQYALINADGDLLGEETYDFIRTPSEGFAAFKKDGKNGFLRINGTVVVPAEYENVADFQDGLAAVRKEGRWGFIDVEGNVVIPIRYENLSAPYFREGLAMVQKDGKCGFIDKTGAMVIAAEYENAYAFDGYLACVRKDGLLGFINKRGEMVIPAAFEQRPGSADIWRGEYAVLCQKNKQGIINRKGEVILPFDYDDVKFYPNMVMYQKQVGDKTYYEFSVKPGGTGLIGDCGIVIEPVYDKIGTFYNGIAAAVKDGKVGYINPEGQTVLPFEYESGSDFNGVCPNYAKVTKDKRTYIIDRTGSEICDKIEPLRFDADPIPGYMGAIKDDKYGVLDNEGNFVIPCEFDSVDKWGVTSLIEVKKDDKFGLYDLSGREILKPEYDRIGTARDEAIPVSLIADWHRKEGVLSAEGKIIMEPVYPSTDVQDEVPVIIVTDKDWNFGLCRYDGSEITGFVFDQIRQFSADGTCVAKKDDKCGLIDINGKWVIPNEYDDITPMTEGLAAAKKDGKWGFINADNEWVVQPAYSRIHREFRHGYAIVKNGDKDILINKAGKELTKPASTLYVREPADGMIRFQVGRKCGYLDLDGNIAIKPAFEEAEDFKNGCAQVSLKVDKEPMWTFVKKDGTIGEPFSDRVFQSDSLIPVAKGDRKGIYRPDGTLAVPFVLKQVSNEKEGVLIVQFA